MTFLPTFYPSEDFYGMTNDELWLEVVRVTKPEGHIIALSFKEMEKQNNFLLDGVIDLFNSNPMIGFTTKENIEKAMIRARIKNVNVVDLNGILLAVGRN